MRVARDGGGGDRLLPVAGTVQRSGGSDHADVPLGTDAGGIVWLGVLLTTAGMQQMIPYFLGSEAPPSRQLTSCNHHTA